ncbi:nucleotidyltransferase domain-containing protein [Acidobacteria bacterium AH-259-G07]|nr:nucleotidyltransferase domain-containing protein [Acidobacteria bacterium AH-259-G07]
MTRKLPALVQALGEVPVRLAYLHGSFVTSDNPSDLSDLDLAFVVKPRGKGDIGDLYLRLFRTCSQFFPDDRLDIAILDETSPEFRFKVIEKGKLIYCRSEQDRIHFEYAAVNDYQDTAFLRDEFHRIMVKAIREGEFFG